jgi:hypothetical protein
MQLKHQLFFVKSHFLYIFNYLRQEQEKSLSVCCIKSIKNATQAAKNDQRET